MNDSQSLHSLPVYCDMFRCNELHYPVTFRARNEAPVLQNCFHHLIRVCVVFYVFFYLLLLISSIVLHSRFLLESLRVIASAGSVKKL